MLIDVVFCIVLISCIIVYFGISMYYASQCVKIARRKKRSNNLWVILAGFFGIIAYWLIQCLPEKNEDKDKRPSRRLLLKLKKRFLDIWTKRK